MRDQPDKEKAGKEEEEEACIIGGASWLTWAMDMTMTMGNGKEDGI